MNVKMVVAYDGTGFHGFATNDGAFRPLPER